ncbi:MAG: ribonuclease H-like domain-containing protein, partial [Deltaproteobacteria bacterium]|nr:ribonuclease H-like domain-containing protein [Deltaproteobacteria bacterium]
MSNEYLVFDLETQRSAEEVGGWSNIAEMRMSVGVVWDSKKQKHFTYLNDQVEDLIAHLSSGPRVIGYNHIGFDYVVLSGYYEKGPLRNQKLQKLKSLKNLDLLLDLKDRIGRRVKLDSVARPTLKIGKSADGLQALQWYKEYLGGDEK